MYLVYVLCSKDTRFLVSGRGEDEDLPDPHDAGAEAAAVAAAAAREGEGGLRRRHEEEGVRQTAAAGCGWGRWRTGRRLLSALRVISGRDEILGG